MSSFSHFADKAPPIPGPGEVLTLEDVAKADFSGVTPLGVLGYPIKHSVSPQMHNAALAVLAKSDPKFANWRYYRLEVPPERLKEALDLLAAKGFVGLNLTIPHKVLAMEWVKTPCAFIPADLAMSAGAMNTLSFDWHGPLNCSWNGCNTDVFGFAETVKRHLFARSDWKKEWPETDVVVIGAGGVARAIAAYCLSTSCRSVSVGNRSWENLDLLRTQLGKMERGGSLKPFLLADAETHLRGRKVLIVNATSLGLKPGDPEPVDLSMLAPGSRVFDVTYGKGFRSAFLRKADEEGFDSCDGLPMLVYQGQQALRVWIEAVDGRLTEDVLSAMCSAMFAAAYAATGVPAPRQSI